jgi:arginase family enzyme
MSAPAELVINPAFEVEVDNGHRHLVNTREGLRLNLTDKVSKAIEMAGRRTEGTGSTAVVDYLQRMRVLVEPDSVTTAAGGISQASTAPVGTSWLREMRDLSRWVTIGCAAGFDPTDFGNPGAGMLAVRRGVGKLLRPEPLWSYDTGKYLGAGAELVLDYGDIVYRQSADRACDVHDRLRFASRQILASGGKPLLIGGDHSLTHPIVSELTETIADLRVVHFDAHADRRPLDETTHGTTPDCGNFVEHLLDGFPDLPLLTIGVRGWTPHHRHIGSRYQYLTADDVIEDRAAECLRDFCAGHSVYITTDIDVLDPSVAPEVAFAAPGGLTLPQLKKMIAIATRSAAVVVGADFVEACGSNTGRNLAAMAQAAAAATLLDNDRIDRDGGSPAREPSC